MILDIVPHVRVGPINFGMTRSEVRALIPGEVRAFKKVPDAMALADAFREQGVHVHYDIDDQCMAIELMAGQFTLHGRPLLHEQFDKLAEWLRGLDSHLKIDVDGLVSDELGIALYAPASDRGDRGVIESVTVFARGFYG